MFNKCFPVRLVLYCLYFRRFLPIGHVQQVFYCPVVVVLPLLQTVSANRSCPTSVFLSWGTALFQTVSDNRSCPASVFLSSCCGTAFTSNSSASQVSEFLSGCCGTAFTSDGSVSQVSEFLSGCCGTAFTSDGSVSQVSEFLSGRCGTAFISLSFWQLVMSTKFI